MLDKICVVCNFAVTNADEVLAAGGRMQSSSQRFATFMSHDMKTYMVPAGMDANTVQTGIAEFVEENSPAVVIDLGNEFGLYTIPPSPGPAGKATATVAAKSAPQQKQDEKKAADRQEDEFAASLQNTIRKYEELIEEQRQKGLDTAPMEKLLISLKAQLNDYLRKQGSPGIPSAVSSFLGTSRSAVRRLIKSPWRQSGPWGKLRKPPITRDDLRLAALREIFLFYNHQRALACIRKTFDAADDEVNQMSMGYFLKVLKDYNIGVELPVCVGAM